MELRKVEILTGLTSLDSTTRRDQGIGRSILSKVSFTIVIEVDFSMGGFSKGQRT